MLQKISYIHLSIYLKYYILVLLGILFYEIYSDIFKEVSFIPGGFDGLFYIFFIYINAFINPLGKNAFSRASINPRWEKLKFGMQE